MKNLILSGLIAMSSLGIANAQEKDQLPQKATNFLNQHFNGVAIEKIEKEDSWYNLDKNEMYEVKLSNGTKLDFNKEGEITEIDGKMAIPAEVIPAQIRTYIDSNYKSTEIIGWEMDDDEQEVKLADGTELEFDDQGNFLKED